MRTQGTYYIRGMEGRKDGRTDGRTEGRKDGMPKTMSLRFSSKRRGTIKMAGEWQFDPSMHQAKGDRLVRARVLSVCNNA